MAHLRRLGFFLGTDIGAAGTIWAARRPITQQEAEGTSANPYESESGGPSLLGLTRMMAMPFAEFMDFQWRVKKWKFSAPNAAIQKTEYFSSVMTSELQLNNLNLIGIDFVNLNDPNQVLPGTYGFVNTYEVQCPSGYPPEQVCSRVCWLTWFNYNIISFGPATLQNRNDQYVNLSYAPALFSQSFAGPNEIIKTGYLTFDVVFGAGGVFPPVTVSISPAEWWTYGGRYSATTGREL